MKLFKRLSKKRKPVVTGYIYITQNDVLVTELGFTTTPEKFNHQMSSIATQMKSLDSLAYADLNGSIIDAEARPEASMAEVSTQVDDIVYNSYSSLTTTT